MVPLSEEDVSNVEKAIGTLKPMKTITMLLWDAKTPTVPLILPLKNSILKDTSSNPDGCPFV